MSLELYAAYVLATLVVLVIPGPTIMLVISYALTHGRRSAAACIAGVGLGDATAATASLLGLGAVLATSATLFTALKWVGALYLVWLGLKMWRTPAVPLQDNPEVDVPADMQPKRIFTHTYVVTSLNPKGIAFFIAFLPHFVSPTAPALPQLVLLGATFVFLGIVNAALYALAAAQLREHIRRPSIQKLFHRLGGTLLISAGLLTAALRRATA